MPRISRKNKKKLIQTFLKRLLSIHRFYPILPTLSNGLRTRFFATVPLVVSFGVHILFTCFLQKHWKVHCYFRIRLRFTDRPNETRYVAVVCTIDWNYLQKHTYHIIFQKLTTFIYVPKLINVTSIQLLRPEHRHQSTYRNISEMHFSS